MVSHKSISLRHDRISVPCHANGSHTRSILYAPAASNVPFFTPEQDVPAGTALVEPHVSLPKLFNPLKIRGVELPNRIWVSPMCQYSALEGFQTPWHYAHYGGIMLRGPAFTMLEATAVQAAGRITPDDAGIWLDSHIDGLRKHVDFAHSQNSLIAIQLAHAGRKASTVPPWLVSGSVSTSSGAVATKEAGGWPDNVVGPTAEPFGAHAYPQPRVISLAEIRQVREDFKAATRRAVHAGFDIIELHLAHGYLVSSFMSPAVNTRTDQYGGSFENRVRLALEIVEDARSVLPDTMPLFVRISASDWLETIPDFAGKATWTIDDSIKLAHLMADRGVDVLDVSSGAIHIAQKVPRGPAYQAQYAKAIKKAVGDKMLVSAVGSIGTGTLAEQVISGDGSEDDVPLDLIAAGRGFLKNPGLVWAWADDLRVPIKQAKQIGWGFRGRVSKEKQ